MFADQLAAEVSTASLKALDHLSHLTWQGHAAGAIADADAQRIAEQIHQRRQAARDEYKPMGRLVGRPSIFPPRRLQRSPDRAASIQRRRTLAASGPMPPSLASAFTTGELAALRVIADAVRDNSGACIKTWAEIAARAGVCRTTAQNAIRMAARLGLVTVQERRRSGQKNAPNVIRIVSKEWLTWLARGGFKKVTPTDTQIRNEGRSAPNAGVSNGYTRTRRWRFAP